MTGLLVGKVTDYDPGRGLGVVTSVSGEAYRFHCTAIVDGTRLIDPGVKVAFVLAAGLGGLFEARELTAV